MRDILITGGLGFIGNEIAGQFVKMGERVTLIDNEISNVVATVPGTMHVRLDAAGYVRSRARHGSDLVIHCASPVGPAGILKYQGRLASMILSQSAAIIRFCSETKTPLVNISTSEVYGSSGVYYETDALRVPATVSTRIEYAIGKMAAEAECRLTPGLKSISIRPFNVAGPLQSSSGGFVLPTFAEQAVSGEAITVYGDGSQQRALTSVTDLARFIVDLEPEDYDGRVVNVGNPDNQTTISALAARVKLLSGSYSTIEHTTGKAVHGDAYEEAEGHIKVPDIALARSMGWEPVVGLDELVASAVEHARGTNEGLRHAGR